MKLIVAVLKPFKLDDVKEVLKNLGVQIAVDDFAQVFVNRASVGSTGSVVYEGVAGKAQNVPAVFDLTAALHAGSNTITVVAQNGPFACDSAQCPYSQDPAGVVFGGTLRW